MKKSILPAILLLAAIPAIYGLITFWQQRGAVTSIKIGVLHSLSGTMASTEEPLVNALQLAIEEINAAGGINGQPLEAVVADCRSDDAYCGQQAERLITEEKVSVLFGCWTSLCRKTVKAVVENHHHLLFYPVQYEGLEHSPNIIYTGSVPNQQIIPATTWALQKLGKRVYLVGSNDIFPRIANLIIKDQLAAQGGALAGERYLQPGSSAMDALVQDIVRQRPQVVLSTISGDSNAQFFAALKRAGLGNLPIISFSVAEAGMKTWGGAGLTQHYAARSYFESLPGEANRRFVAAYRARFGADQTTSERMEDSYIGVYLWGQAAREAGSAEPGQVQRCILRQTLNAPEGMVAVDQQSRHLWKTPRIGKVRRDGQFDIVWEAPQALEPSPFPRYRQVEEWQNLLQIAEGQQR